MEWVLLYGGVLISIENLGFKLASIPNQNQNMRETFPIQNCKHKATNKTYKNILIQYSLIIDKVDTLMRNVYTYLNFYINVSTMNGTTVLHC